MFRANIKWCLFRKSNKFLGQNPIREVLIVTAITAAVSYMNPYTRKSGAALIKQLFDRCGPEDYMQDLCDYRNKTFTADKIDDNYHTGDMGFGVQVGRRLFECSWNLTSSFCFCLAFLLCP